MLNDFWANFCGRNAPRGLIEAMGAPLVNEEEVGDDVEGWLTAVDIMARICELLPDDIREIVGEDA